MLEELPIACSLGADDLPARLRTIAVLGRDALIDARTHGPSARLRFAAVPGIRERLDAVVAAESHCCAFLTMAVTQAEGEIELRIDAPEDAELVLAELVESFSAEPAAA